jgi:hypothetical protein
MVLLDAIRLPTVAFVAVRLLAKRFEMEEFSETKLEMFAAVAERLAIDAVVLPKDAMDAVGACTVATVKASTYRFDAVPPESEMELTDRSSTCMELIDAVAAAKLFAKTLFPVMEITERFPTPAVIAIKLFTRPLMMDEVVDVIVPTVMLVTTAFVTLRWAIDAVEDTILDRVAVADVSVDASTAVAVTEFDTTEARLAEVAVTLLATRLLMLAVVAAIASAKAEVDRRLVMDAVPALNEFTLAVVADKLSTIDEVA